MPTRIAAILALIAFALSLLIGAFDAHNTLVTTVWRAIVMMGMTLVVGYVVGVMADTMLKHHLSDVEKKNSKRAEEAAENRR